jgi:microcystin-dependent protein
MMTAAGLVAGSAARLAVAATPQTTVQPSLGIYEAVEANSAYGFTGAVQMFAGYFAPGGTLPANGPSLSTTAQPSLYSAIGTTYGGGNGTFQLPNLADVTGIGSGQGSGLTNRPLGTSVGQSTVTLTTANAPASLGGGGQSFTNMQPSLALNYYICEQGAYDAGGGNAEPAMASIVASASPNAPNGYAACDGQTLPISEYQALFTLLGTQYGGNGSTTFNLPDLRGRTAMGAGSGPGLTTRTLGQQVGAETTTLTAANFPAPYGSGQSYSNVQPSLVLNYIIATQGVYPTRDGTADNFDSPSPVLGQVELYAGSNIPTGWALCNGQTLSLSQNTALFSLLGTEYGGDGRTTFDLPDFRGRIAVGDDNDSSLTGAFGVESLPTNASELPAVSPEPTALALLGLSTAPLLALRRRRRHG